MKIPIPNLKKINLKAVWVQLSRRQRRTLIIIGMANLIAISALLALLQRAPPSLPSLLETSPLSPQRTMACRQAVSRALLDAGHSGLVQTTPDGTIVIQLDRDRGQVNRPTITTNLRLDADAATWAALQAVAGAARPDAIENKCLGFNTLQVTVIIQPLTPATTRVSIPDLLAWSLGEIDDAELALRLDYRPPATFTPTSLDATATP